MFTSSHFMISLELNAQGDDAASYVKFIAEMYQLKVSVILFLFACHARYRPIR